MRSLAVVATSARCLNRFSTRGLVEALNLKDFLEETGEFASVSIYEQEASGGRAGEWAELQSSPP